MKNSVQKYIFKCLACFFVFVMVLDGHLSSCASCSLNEGGTQESYGELSLFFFFVLFAEMECLSSFLARENHWPSLFFFFCFSAQTKA